VQKIVAAQVDKFKEVSKKSWNWLVQSVQTVPDARDHSIIQILKEQI
jgi:hypothetical protein